MLEPKKETSFKYRKLLDNKGTLDTFNDSLRKFDQAFLDFLVAGSEFTIKLEVRGSAGKLVHCRVYTDDLERTPAEPSSTSRIGKSNR